MLDITVGQEIGVRCDIQSGPFPDEYVITIETLSGPVSGFVLEKNLLQSSGAESHVRAIVKDIGADAITVWISGSFFTTTGLAEISPHIAAANLQ